MASCDLIVKRSGCIRVLGRNLSQMDLDYGRQPAARQVFRCARYRRIGPAANPEPAPEIRPGDVKDGDGRAQIARVVRWAQDRGGRMSEQPVRQPTTRRMPAAHSEQTGFLLRVAFVRAGEVGAAEVPQGMSVRFYGVLLT